MITKKVEGKIAMNMKDRPLAMVVQVASKYDSIIHINNGEMQANAKSIMGMMTMTMNPGNTLVITADGPDEKQAVDALENYILGR
jgi:phosphotransferase system HPr (HPr) family protein